MMTLKVVHEDSRSSVYVKESFMSSKNEKEDEQPQEDAETLSERSATDSLLKRRDSEEFFKNALAKTIRDISNSIDEEARTSSKQSEELTVSSYRRLNTDFSNAALNQSTD